MKGLTLKVSIEWVKESPSCLTCIVCEDTIYSNTYRLNYIVNDKVKESNIVTCESCNELIK